MFEGFYKIFAGDIDPKTARHDFSHLKFIFYLGKLQLLRMKCVFKGQDLQTLALKLSRYRQT